jgi:beta-glucosidase
VRLLLRTVPVLLAAAAVAACGERQRGVAAGRDEGGQDGAVARAMAAEEASAASSPDAGSDATQDGAAVDGATPDPDTPAVESRVSALVAQMTLDEKVGQMTQVGFTFLASSDDITTYGLGSVLAGGDDAPPGNTPGDWLAMTAEYRAKAAATRLKIPILFGIDAVHGNAKVKGATVFPHDIGMGCARDTDLVTRAQAVTAAETLAMGITWVFSPDVDVGRDERWGRTYESYGEDPALVSAMATAAVRGYQGMGLGSPGAVLACAKHALGAGGTTWGSGVDGGIDEGDVAIDEAGMRAIHLPPFQAAIGAGAMSIMVSYSSFQGVKMSASSKWLTDVVKGELGFRGFLVSDWGAIYQLPGTRRQAAAAAINSGIDMVMVPDDYVDFIADVKALVGDGTIAQTRIDDAVRRILRAKVLAGVFEASAPDPGGLAAVGSDAHRTIARQAVRESLVLLKNDGAVLPLSKSAHVHVAGRGASDLGVQAGGWTLGWQGGAGVDAAALGGGTTILDALRSAAGSSGLVTYSADGKGAAGAAVGVVVLSENPYAEYYGDTPDPSFDNRSSPAIYDGTAAATVANMAAAKIPLVLVLLTGRPVRIESLLPKFGAVVAAWLPGSEGAGVADVLYGDANFVGTLSKSWPRDTTILPIAHDQSGYDPLFAYGFGLRYP